MTDFFEQICIGCANGKDLPDGEYCRMCGREGTATGLGAAVIRARRGYMHPNNTQVGNGSGHPLPALPPTRIKGSFWHGYIMIHSDHTAMPISHWEALKFWWSAEDLK